MNRAACGIKGVLDTLGNQLKILEAEIKVDQEGKMEFERELAKLEQRKQEIEERIEANMAWAKSYGTDFGPFEQMYLNKTQAIGNIYDDAKARHRAGIKVLKAEFNYHPEFKRPKDTFRATPFVPR
ncbi:unnamed protein product [Discosporangium mesarthrocarpum]